MHRQTSPIVSAVLFAFTLPGSIGWAADLPASGRAAEPEAGLYLGRPLEFWIAQATAGQRTEETATIVEALSAAFGGQELNTKVAAADALRNMGPAAQPAAVVLAGELDHIQPWIRTAAMDALAAMGAAAVPAVLHAVQTGPAGARVRALMVLAAIGSEAEAALPVLEQAARGESEAMRARLLETIAAIRGQDSGAATRRREGASFRDLQEPNFVAIQSDTLEWPQFHGPRRDALCTETGLMKDWSQGGPRLLWQQSGLGTGYSSISIAAGKIFTMGDRQGTDGKASQFAMALDLESHQPLWATRVGPPHSDGPRCTPTFDEGTVYVVGTSGDLLALEAGSGQVVWQRSLSGDFGGQMMSGWMYSESPLIDGPRLICTPGGPEAMMVALDKKTGATIWKCVMPSLGEAGKDGAGYSSAVAAEIGGVRQYVQMLGRGVIGVEAETGRFLWGYNRIANGVANIPTPVVRGDYVFATTSYKTGSALLKIQRDGDGFSAEEIYFLSPRDFENHHGGVVLVGDYIYGGDGQNTGHPVCLKLATGEIQWKTRGPASGSAAVLYADGHLLFRYDRGPLALIEATPKEFRLKGTFQPLAGSGPAWAHPVIHQGRLYLRHGDLLACYDLRENSE